MPSLRWPARRRPKDWSPSNEWLLNVVDGRVALEDRAWGAAVAALLGGGASRTAVRQWWRFSAPPAGRRPRACVDPQTADRAKPRDRDAHGRVQADELVLEPELPPALRQGLAAQQQRLEHRSVELPRAMLVRIGEGRPARGGDPRCLSLPSLLRSPPQISRSEWARPSWQNSMATNCLSFAAKVQCVRRTAAASVPSTWMG
jgi:hypothetical protein